MQARMEYNKELIKTVATGAMISIMAGLIKMLLSKSDPLIVRVRVFFAGVLLGTLASFILRYSSMNEFVKEVLIGGLSAFSSAIWPVLEKMFISWVNKKKNHDDNRDNRD